MFDTLFKINYLITKRQRKGIFVLTFLLLVGMFLEVFGLGIIIPTISILLDPSYIKNNEFLLEIKSFLSNYTLLDFKYIFLCFILIIFFIKTIFLVFLSFIQNKFLSSLIANVSNKLFNNYLSQPYAFHTSNNSSDLLKNIQLEIINLNTFIFSTITVLLEGSFIFSIVLTLIIIEPIGAVSLGIFYGLLSYIFLSFTKSKLKNWGQNRSYFDKKISRIALESFGIIKELIVLNRTSFFIRNFSNYNIEKSKLNAKMGTVSQIPRYYLELLSVIGLLIFLVFQLYNDVNPSNLLATLGVFVAASFRLIPSINKILSSSQSIKFHGTTLDIIYSELKNNQITQIDDQYLRDINFNKIISFQNVTFKYDEQIILDNINFEILKGQVIGIVGESGSGKSTLIDLLMGLYEPNSGKIKVDDLDYSIKSKKIKLEIGYVSQNIFLLDSSIKENIALGVPISEIDEKRIIQLLKEVQLEFYLNNLIDGINSKVGEKGIQISGGQKQRIGIARALYHNPKILVLDEATSALDSRTEKEVMNTIYNLKKDKTIIIISHRLSTLDKVDVLYKIKNKKIFKT